MTLAVKHISSRDNPFFKELLKLAGSARQRRRAGQMLLDGVHLVQAFSASGKQPLHLLVTPHAAQDNAEVISLLKKMRGVPITHIDERLFAELTELKTPSGIIALAEIGIPQVSAAQSGFCLLLEDIQDPGNLGSMLRSAAAAGCDAVFLSKGCADAWSPKVLRAGMGGHFALNIHEHVDLTGIAAEFHGQVLAAVPDAKASLYDCELHGRLGFVFGNEGAGLSEELLSVLERRVAIPMPGQVESLNVAAAAAVCLFEAVRQRSCR